MGRQIRPRSAGRALLVTGLFVSLAPPALADANYCVTCKNPDQTYRCRVTGEAPSAADALKLYCIIRTAQDGKHSSCSAERRTSGCSGPEKVYAFDGAALSSQIASDPRVRGAVEQMRRQQDAFAKPKGATPSTVFELGGRAVSASRQGWQNARERIGGSSSASAPVAAQPAPSPAAAPLPSPPRQTAAPTTVPESAPLPPSAPAEAASATASTSPDPQSESRMKRASSAVGGFARKSYRCMRSFFRSCSDEAAQTLQ